MPEGKGNRVNTPDVTTEGDRAKRRFLRLIEELGTEEGAPGYGWKSRVARRLNLSQGYVNRLISKERVSVGADSIDKVVQRLRIDRKYFYDAREPSSYKEYSSNSKEPVFQAWKEFRESPIGSAINEAERAALATFAVPDGGEPTVAFYEGVLYMMQNRITPAEFERGLAKANEIDERMRIARKRADTAGKRSPK